MQRSMKLADSERKKNIDLMVFDLDGTLINSGGDIITSVNHTLKTLDIPTREPDEIIGFVGDGIQKMIERSLGKDFQHLFSEAIDIFSMYYDKHMLDTTTLCDSVIEVLEYFSGKWKIIITNKRKYFTVKMTDALGISKYFDEIIGADSTEYKKPDPRLLLPLITIYDVGYDHTVVIGDGINDIMLAKNAGVVSCALMNGLTSRDILLALNPDFTCEGLFELISIFR